MYVGGLYGEEFNQLLYYRVVDVEVTRPHSTRTVVLGGDCRRIR